MSPRPGTSSSQPRFTSWLHLGISNSSTSSNHCRLFHSSGRVALGKTQVVADLGLQHPGNPRASTHSGQLSTMLEQHYPVPAQLILHGGWRLVVSGHSHFLQLTVYVPPIYLPTATKAQLQEVSVPRVLSLDDKGGCTTGLYRTPTTLGHTTKTWSQSNPT